VLAALGLIAEGAIYDWSVLYMQQELGSPQKQAALAYAAFSAAMAAARFGGDAMRARFTPEALLRGSGLVAAASMTLVLLTDLPWLALAGFAINALLLMACRVPFAMSRDRLLPVVLQRVNRGGTPAPALVTSTLVALVCIATNTFNTLLAMLAFLFVANYGLVFTAFFVSRYRAPDAARPFRVPGYPFVPGCALAGSLAFMAGAVLGDRTNSMLALAVLAISWPIYRMTRPREAR